MMAAMMLPSALSAIARRVRGRDPPHRLIDAPLAVALVALALI